MNAEAMLALLQFADGLFPAGNFAHSYGLETYVQQERIRDAADLEQFIRVLLQDAAGSADAVAVTNALRAAVAGDLELCLKLDADLEAMKAAAESREASRQLGRQTLRVLSAVTDHPFVGQYARQADANLTPCHHAVIFGIAGGALGWEPRPAALAYLYAACSGLVGAALRLLPIGQLRGQKIIRQLTPLIASLAAAAACRSSEEMTSFAPGLEIAAMCHARLEARLFRS
jgi:urease accessory protein